MHKITLLCCLAFAVACSSNQEDGLSRSPVGKVSMPLVAQVGGVAYRLAMASFEVTGNTAIVLSSDDDPEAEALTATLPRGTYQVTLVPGWRLLRVEAGVSTEVDTAFLITPNPTSVDIAAGTTAGVVFKFGVPNGTVTFGGTLQITIDVLTACDPLSATSCGPDQTCFLGPEVGECRPPAMSPHPVGEDCADNGECDPIAVCVDTGAGQTCLALCSLGTECGPGVPCNPINVDNYGVCL